MGEKIGFYICSAFSVLFEVMLAVLFIDGGVNAFLTALWSGGIFLIVLLFVLGFLIFHFFIEMEKRNFFTKLVLILNVPQLLFAIIIGSVVCGGSFVGDYIFYRKGLGVDEKKKNAKYVIKNNCLYKKKDKIAEIEFVAPNGDIICKDGNIYNINDLNSDKTKI